VVPEKETEANKNVENLVRSTAEESNPEALSDEDRVELCIVDLEVQRNSLEDLERTDHVCQV